MRTVDGHTACNRRVLLVCPSLGAGGIEKSMVWLAEEFHRRAYEIDFLVCLPSKQPFYTLQPGIRPIKFGKARKLGMFGSAGFYLRLALFIRGCIKRSKPDAVISFGDYFAPLVLASQCFLGVRTYVSDRMSPLIRFPIYIRAAKRLLYPFASGYIAQTQRAANHAAKKYGRKLPIQIVPNSVQLNPAKRRARKNVVLCAGRLHSEKGMDIAIRAFAKAKLDNWSMYIAGEGSERFKLEALIRKVSMEHRIFLLGQRNDLPELMEEAKIFLLPSRSEGFPNALCEAMSAGMACVAFKDLVDPIIISNERNDGVLVTKKTTAELAKALDGLASDEDAMEALGSRARMICERLDPLRNFELLESFIFRGGDQSSDKGRKGSGKNA